MKTATIVATLELTAEERKLLPELVCPSSSIPERELRRVAQLRRKLKDAGWAPCQPCAGYGYLVACLDVTCCGGATNRCESCGGAGVIPA